MDRYRHQKQTHRDRERGRQAARQTHRHQTRGGLSGLASIPCKKPDWSASRGDPGKSRSDQFQISQSCIWKQHDLRLTKERLLATMRGIWEFAILIILYIITHNTRQRQRKTERRKKKEGSDGERLRKLTLPSPLDMDHKNHFSGSAYRFCILPVVSHPCRCEI
jgi:hypothetical protein